MNFLIIAAVTPAAAGGEENVLQRFGVEPAFLGMQIISFLILAWVLYRYMIKPIVATVDERNEKIESGLKYADEMKVKLEALQQESIASAKKAQAEATKIIDEARKSAKEFLDKQSQEAGAKASDMLVKAQQVIELEKKKMLAEARTEIARLVVATTQKVLAKELSEADRSRYNESAARELNNV
jgi:F-type H+-transporting ATPase subunit b